MCPFTGENRHRSEETNVWTRCSCPCRPTHPVALRETDDKDPVDSVWWDQQHPLVRSSCFFRRCACIRKQLEGVIGPTGSLSEFFWQCHTWRVSCRSIGTRVPGPPCDSRGLVNEDDTPGTSSMSGDPVARIRGRQSASVLRLPWGQSSVCNSSGSPGVGLATGLAAGVAAGLAAGLAAATGMPVGRQALSSSSM